MKYASFGSISSGTMRAEDLVPCFASELEDNIQRNAEEWCSEDGRKERDRLLAIAAEANELEDYEGDDASEILQELFDALETFAPPYGYFGSHEGDGADYGFWLTPMDYFDGLKVNDTSEVPADYSGEVLHVNDHGNCTLYVADNGELTEVWAVV